MVNSSKLALVSGGGILPRDYGAISELITAAESTVGAQLGAPAESGVVAVQSRSMFKNAVCIFLPLVGFLSSMAVLVVGQVCDPSECPDTSLSLAGAAGMLGSAIALPSAMCQCFDR